MTRGYRIGLLALSVCAGVGVGIAGDLLDPAAFEKPENAVSIGTVLVSILGSPAAIPLGAGAVTIQPLAPFLFGAGLVFYPVLATLAVFWLRGGRRWLCVAIFLWCAQGFFQLLHRVLGIPQV